MEYPSVIGNLCKRKQKIKSTKTVGYVFTCLLFTVFLFLNVAYSALNTNLLISSDVSFRVFEDIRITNVEILGATNGGLIEYNPNYSKDTVKTGVSLPNLDSTVTYKITVQNTGNTVGTFTKINKTIYSNSYISYVIDGLEAGDLIEPQTSITFTITFYYNRTSLPSNRKLDSILQFVFTTKMSIMMANSGTVATDFYNRSDIARNKIESIKFLNTVEVPTDALASFDFSATLGEGSVMMWYKDTDSNGLYEVYIGGINGVYSNKVSAHMFNNMTALKEIDFAYLDTSLASSMTYMFNGASSIKNIDVSSFNTDNVTTMQSMFSGMTSLESLDLSTFNTPKLLNIYAMFNGSTNLTSLDVSGLDTSLVTNMTSAFSNLTNLTSLDVSHFNTKNVSLMSSMFNGSGIIHLDLSHFDTTSLTGMSNMFYGMKNLETLDLSNWNTPKLETIQYAFNGASKLKSLDLSDFNTQKVKSFNNLFSAMTSLENLDISNFDTSSATTMSSMFNGLSNLTSLDVSHFNTSNAENMANMFRGMSSLITLKVDNFDTSKVESMSYMFQGLLNLKELDLSSFDTGKVTNMQYMFQGCSKLKSLDLTTWNTENVTTVSNMFYNATSLEVVKLNAATSTSITAMDGMFRSMTSLKELHLNNWEFKGTTSNIFLTIPSPIKIYVKDQTAYNFVKSLQPTWNVEVVSNP